MKIRWEIDTDVVTANGVPVADIKHEGISWNVYMRPAYRPLFDRKWQVGRGFAQVRAVLPFVRQAITKRQMEDRQYGRGAANSCPVL